MNTPLDLYVVIPVFNRKKMILNLLKLLREQSYNDFNVVVVDDGSTDGTEEIIRKFYPKTHIVKGDGNWWWTKSANEGCKFAISKGAAGILLMNDDTEVRVDYFQKLVDSIVIYPDSVIGSLSLTVESPHKIFFSGIKKLNLLTAKATRYHKQFVLYYPDKIKGTHKTEFLPGRGLYIPSKVFDKIGFLNEKELPQYAADFDFTNRAKRNAYNVLINWDLIVYSHWKMTGKGASYTKQKFSEFLRAFTNRYSHRSIKTAFYYYKAMCPWYILPITLINHHIRVFYSYFIKT